MLDLTKLRSVHIPIPQPGKPFPGFHPFFVALVHKKYPQPVSSTTTPRGDPENVCDYEKIQMGLASGVYRAWTGQRGQIGSKSFVVKFSAARSDSSHKALEREAKVYNEQLQPLQGKDVPIFFGYFEGEFREESDGRPFRVSCIFLEDCGDAVEYNFIDLPLADRAELLKKIGRIHLCGVSLNDFHERNVVVKDGSYRFIDFQDVDLEHDCFWEGDRVYEGEVVPKYDEMGCPEMIELGFELDLWKSPLAAGRCVEILGKTRPKTEFPPQEAIDVLCKGVRSYHSDSEKRFHNWIKKYKDYQQRMSPEEYMKRYPMPDISLTRKQLGKDFEK
ncbi:hypothetical protein SCHPADRAFT_933692 [Schizopora paradoxa]|uniref:Protein kinase domain-containing protein n=1 Tax=Schizopora paradoxa TaxID=27342 RepID=A0A0H2R1X7_9AGAM|nr:hypothetical protein SCHPADRAFT_933692 [Schizopora paradoxa]